jgi:hypothetical protein
MKRRKMKILKRKTKERNKISRRNKMTSRIRLEKKRGRNVNSITNRRMKIKEKKKEGGEGKN